MPIRVESDFSFLKLTEADDRRILEADPESANGIRIGRKITRGPTPPTNPAVGDIHLLTGGTVADVTVPWKLANRSTGNQTTKTIVAPSGADIEPGDDLYIIGGSFANQLTGKNCTLGGTNMTMINDWNDSATLSYQQMIFRRRLASGDITALKSGGASFDCITMLGFVVRGAADVVPTITPSTPTGASAQFFAPAASPDPTTEGALIASLLAMQFERDITAPGNADDTLLGTGNTEGKRAANLAFKSSGSPFTFQQWSWAGGSSGYFHQFMVFEATA